MLAPLLPSSLHCTLSFGGTLHVVLLRLKITMLSPGRVGTQAGKPVLVPYISGHRTPSGSRHKMQRETIGVVFVSSIWIL